MALISLVVTVWQIFSVLVFCRLVFCFLVLFYLVFLFFYLFVVAVTTVGAMADSTGGFFGGVCGCVSML